MHRPAAFPAPDHRRLVDAAVRQAGACELVPGLQLVNQSIQLPFDVMRSQHAQAVRAGLLARSMLESRDFERAVDALEHLTLGPFARHV
jgi:hypothetical protein